MRRVVPLGVLVDGLAALPSVLDAFLDHPAISSSDLTIGAPLFKATPELAEAHKALRSARERFHAYLSLGVLNEPVRAQVAQRFVKTYRQRHGRVERRDVFLASADMCAATVNLRTLKALDPLVRREVIAEILRMPHDREAVERELVAAGESLPEGEVEPPDLTVYQMSLKIFVDQLSNPVRLKDPEVIRALDAMRCAEPVVIEFWAAPALPGYPFIVVRDVANAVGGMPVWMELYEVVR
ncbi:MAG: hypothetical protein JXR83_15200 [Deltaproteobacteria bacterium]|nr:hypothetical protein [Deltaproteobacteria bacterium]